MKESSYWDNIESLKKIYRGKPVVVEMRGLRGGELISLGSKYPDVFNMIMGGESKFSKVECVLGFLKTVYPNVYDAVISSKYDWRNFSGEAQYSRLLEVLNRSFGEVYVKVLEDIKEKFGDDNNNINSDIKFNITAMDMIYDALSLCIVNSPFPSDKEHIREMPLDFAMMLSEDLFRLTNLSKEEQKN